MELDKMYYHAYVGVYKLKDESVTSLWDGEQGYSLCHSISGDFSNFL